MRGNITAVTYREILKEQLLPFLDKFGRDYRYEQDNAPLHNTKIV